MNKLILPLGNGMAVAEIPYPINEEDFELLIATLQLWKKAMTKPEIVHTGLDSPAQEA